MSLRIDRRASMVLLAALCGTVTHAIGVALAPSVAVTGLRPAHRWTP